MARTTYKQLSMKLSFFLTPIPSAFKLPDEDVGDHDLCRPIKSLIPSFEMSCTSKSKSPSIQYIKKIK
jgi:hypothetical protein